MQYTPHYNFNLPEGTDLVNPLIQDNPNYSAIDTALYANKLRVVGTATHTKTGTNHSIVLADSDIPVFRFIATGDYVTGDTFSVDGVTVTPRVADGSSVPTGAFKINSTVEAILDGTILNLINVDGTKPASAVSFDNTSSGLAATDVQDAIDEINTISQQTATILDPLKVFSMNECRKFGKVVTVSLRCNSYNIATGSTEVIAQIPAGFAPSTAKFFNIIGLDSNGYPAGNVMGSIGPDGTLSVIAGSNITGLIFAVTYVM